MGKDRKELDLLLLAPDLIYRLDEKWIELRDGMLDGKVNPLRGLDIFRCCVVAALKALEHEGDNRKSASPGPQAGGIPIIDLGDDSDDDLTDSSPTQPRLLARVDTRRILRVADEAVKESARPKDFDPVEDWRARVQNFYENYGFRVEVPRPEVTREELANWRADGWELLFRLAEGFASYKRLMYAFGHPKHWTLHLQQEEMDDLSWEPTQEGYWFLAEAREVCPRTGKTYEEFMQEIPEGHQLLCLEEYVVLWHVMKDTLGEIMDFDGPTLLRTNYSLNEVLHIRSNIDKTEVELIVRSSGKGLTSGEVGTRYCRRIPSAA